MRSRFNRWFKRKKESTTFPLSTGQLGQLVQEFKTFYPGPFTTSTGFGSSVAAILDQQVAGYVGPIFLTYLQFYQRIEPLANAVDLLATTLSSVQVKLLDSSTKEYVDSAPILDLLHEPNVLPNSSYCNFISETSKFYSITGNCFFIVTLSTRKVPLEIYVVPPQYLSWNIGSDGYVDSYTYTPQKNSVTFVRNENFQYFNRDGSQQLLHLMDFQPNAYDFYAFGLSRLNAIFYELDQYEKASQHNISLLANGARIGSFIKMKEDLTPEQEEYFRAELQNIFVGQQNAGRPIVASGVESIDRLSLTNTDMDFVKLKEMVTEAIYNRLQIPLALIKSTGLSLTNMETAKLNLYDFAVLPQLTTILNFLGDNLLPYYGQEANWRLTYDPFTIDALRDRRLEELQKMASFNVMSDNEIRDRMDMPDYAGGDEIYKPANSVPVIQVSEQVEQTEAGNLRTVPSEL